jgi:hypothetical protein
MANPITKSYSDLRPSNPFSQPNSRDEDIFMTDDRRESQSPQRIGPKPELAKPLLPHEGVARAIALYDFPAVEVCLFFLLPSISS